MDDGRRIQILAAMAYIADRHGWRVKVDADGVQVISTEMHDLDEHYSCLGDTIRYEYKWTVSVT